ncbi:MAG: response regulator [Myxococcota bacterium]
MQMINILLVDDDETDVMLTKRALARDKLHLNVSVVDNGQKCLDFMRKLPPYQEAATPDLVLLDLHMPVMDGHQVLRQIRADPALRRIPVIVLTTSSAEHDILKSYDLFANSYITKPVTLAELTRVVDTLEQFWFTVVRLPVKK